MNIDIPGLLSPNKKGWECPKCGTIYAPTWPSCHCSSITDNGKTIELLEEIKRRLNELLEAQKSKSSISIVSPFQHTATSGSTPEFNIDWSILFNNGGNYS